MFSEPLLSKPDRLQTYKITLGEDDMKNNAKSYREIIALIGIALIVTDIARTSQAREFADKSKFTRIEIPAAFGIGALPSGINPRGDIVGTYTAIINETSNSLGFLLSKGTFTTHRCTGIDSGEYECVWDQPTRRHCGVLRK
jgi:hypothetical protein